MNWNSEFQANACWQMLFVFSSCLFRSIMSYQYLVLFLNRNRPVKVSIPFKMSNSNPNLYPLNRLSLYLLSIKHSTGEMTQTIGTHLSFTANFVKSPNANSPSSGP